jgi:hypothetical protein
MYDSRRNDRPFSPVLHTDVASEAFLDNAEGRRERARPAALVSRRVEVLQDLLWSEFVAAAQMTDRFDDVDTFREAIAEAAFRQPSIQTRQRAASYFVKWFLPNLTFDDPVARCWRGFRDVTAREHVMRWQFISSNSLIATFVDEHLAHADLGSPIDGCCPTVRAGRPGAR